MRILTIDDDRIALHSLSRILRRNGHTVWEAISGVEALQCVEHMQFDLIMVDYYLGDMNGADFVNRLTLPIPVILVSGAPQSEDSFFAVVEKPYSENTLLSAIRKVLG